MIRKRSTPWIHRYSRIIMAAISLIGILITGYLTVQAFSGGGVACPIDPATGKSSCDAVLTSPYAKVFDLPLSLFGLLAYLTMLGLTILPFFVNSSKGKKLRGQVEDVTWQLMFLLGTAMAVFSGYLMYIAFFKLEATCYYCVASALCSLSLFVLSLLGRSWEEIGPVIFRGIVITVITLVSTLGLYAHVDKLNASVEQVAPNGKIYAPGATTEAKPPIGWEVTTTSGPSEIALAEHLAASGAMEYAAFWCPFCYMQKQLFGKEAAAKLPHTECDPQGIDGNPQACRDAGVKAFPTWVIKGEIHEGLISLEELARLSGYKGPMDFKYTPGKVKH